MANGQAPIPEPTISPTPSSDPGLPGLIDEADQLGVESKTIQLVRDAQMRGILDQVPLAKRVELADKIDGEMKVERARALQSKNEIAKSSVDPNNFTDQILADMAETVDRPDLALFQVGRGAAASFNPIPAVNLMNKVNPWSGPPLPEDFPYLEGIFKFPIIRGSEIAQQLWVSEDEQSPLTTFAEVVENQRQLDADLRNAVPGTFEMGFAGMALYQGYQALNAAGQVGMQLARGGKAKMATAINKFNVSRAARAERKTRKLARRLIREGDGPFLDAMVQRPERVRRLVEESSDLTINDIAIRLTDELEDISTNLGETVGSFRDVALADDITRVKIPNTPDDSLVDTLAMIRSRTTFQGKSVLPAKFEKQLRAAEEMASMGVTTPREGLIFTDLLDSVIDWGKAHKNKHIQTAQFALQTARRQIKNAVRGASANAEEWAAADDAFTGFVAESDKLITRLKRDSGESLVANLFGKNKTRLRGHLEKALDFAEVIDPTAKGHGEAFFAELADIKAAEKIRTVALQVADSDADNAARIVKEWVNRGRRIGETVGTAGAGFGGFASSGGGGIQTGVSTVSGYLGGKAIGAEVGLAIGKRVADPTRILNQAIKAKHLSTDVRKLAMDLRYMVKTFGPEGGIAFLDLVGFIPPVNGLIEFSKIMESKGEKNAGK